MKKTVLAILIVCSLFLQGCSGISQEEYDSLKQDRDSLQEEYNSLKQDKNTLQGEYDSLKQNNDTLQKEYNTLVKNKDDLENDLKRINNINQTLLEERRISSEKETALAFVNAWATTNFGDDCIVFPDNNEYLQVISTEKHNPSVNEIKKIWNTVLKSLVTLTIFSEEIKYEKVALKFLQTDNTGLFEVVLKLENDNYEFDSVSGNLFKTPILLDAVSEIINE